MKALSATQQLQQLTAMAFLPPPSPEKAVKFQGDLETAVAADKVEAALPDEPKQVSSQMKPLVVDDVIATEYTGEDNVEVDVVDTIEVVAQSKMLVYSSLYFYFALFIFVLFNS